MPRPVTSAAAIGLLLCALPLGACAGPLVEAPGRRPPAPPSAEVERAARTLAAYLEKRQRVVRVAHRLIRVADAAYQPGPREGFFMAEASPASCALFGHPESCTGVLVVSVDPEGPAEGVVLPGDVVAAVDEQAVHHIDDLAAAGGARELHLTVVRHGVSRAVTVEREWSPVGVAWMLLPSESLNAYAGEDAVAVTTKLVDIVGDDDELAAVLGHELAHLALGHASAADRAALATDQERHADRLGVEYAARAGYDPRGALRFFRKLNMLARGRVLGPYYEVHPPYPERLSAVREQVDEITRRAAQNAF